MTQKDIDNIKSLHKTGHFSVAGISDITKRGWGTINFIIKSNFQLDEYRKLTREAKAQSKNNKEKKKPLTFGPEDEASQYVKIDPYGNDVLNYMHDLQQEQAKQLVKKAERGEAIHKIRNGLQQLSEGLGELL